jgi:hypothetical protein
MFGQSHLFSPAYPRFFALGGATAELARGGDSSRKKGKESPPWVCEKCARKHDPSMGCGEVVIYDPANLWAYSVETTEDIDQVLDSSLAGDHFHRTEAESMGCKKCQDRRRKPKKQPEGYYTPFNMHGTQHGIQVANLGRTHRVMMGQAAQDYTCPVATATSYDPSLNCMRDVRGNFVCSDGRRGPPGCPSTPPDQYFTPGVTPDIINGSILEGQVPPPRGGSGPAPVAGGGAPSGGVSTTTVVAAGAGALGLGALLFFLFK